MQIIKRKFKIEDKTCKKFNNNNNNNNGIKIINIYKNNNICTIY